MDFVKFPEVNVTYAKDQPEYRPIPVHRVRGDSHGRITFCWALSWRERFQVLFTGRIWHQVLTFNGALQPQLLSIEKPDLT